MAKKLFTLLTLLTFVFGVGWATTEKDDLTKGDWHLVYPNQNNIKTGENYEYILVPDEPNMLTKVAGPYENGHFTALPFEGNVVIGAPDQRNNPTLTITSDEVKRFTLENAGQGNYYLKDADGNYYHPDANGNIVQSKEALRFSWSQTGVQVDILYNSQYRIGYNPDEPSFESCYRNAANYSKIRMFYRRTPATLADIAAEDNYNMFYTISDELLVTKCIIRSMDDMTFAIMLCKDNGLSHEATDMSTIPENCEDYMTEHVGFNGDWDQSNWIMLSVLLHSEQDVAKAQAFEGMRLAANCITFYNSYQNGDNFTGDVDVNDLVIAEGCQPTTYTPNLYCPANFVERNLYGNATGHDAEGNPTENHYFFMNPKMQEYCEITYAVWRIYDGEGAFELPEPDGTNNPDGIIGGVWANWSLNNDPITDPETGHVIQDWPEGLEDGAMYRFKAVVFGPDGQLEKGAPYTIMPFDFDPKEHIITGIKDVVDVTDKTVAGVKYYNLAGIENERPFEGVNIIVTTYTDGSRSSTKVLK